MNPSYHKPAPFLDARMCFASTSHITQNDDRLLAAECAAESSVLVVTRHSYGYFLYLDDDLIDNAEGYVDELKSRQFSKEIIQLLVDAKKAGFHYLDLDRDQPAYENRPVFHW